jgi:hypothetical protein
MLLPAEDRDTQIRRIDDWVRALGKYSCPCGSGGPLACDEDCPGDMSDPNVKEALVFILEHIKRQMPEGNR